MRLGDVLDEARRRTFVATPAQVFADPAVAGRILALGAGAPQYPMPGPNRAQLLATIGG